MTTDLDLIRAYGKAVTLRKRFCVLGIGLLGFFCPGVLVHALMKAFKTRLDDKDLLYMLNLTEKL